MGGFEDGASVRVHVGVVFAFVGGAGDKVVAVVLAVVGGRVETLIGVEPFGAVGPLVGAGPLDPVAVAQLVVGQGAVVAGASPRHRREGIEARFGRLPLQERG